MGKKLGFALRRNKEKKAEVNEKEEKNETKQNRNHFHGIDTRTCWYWY